MILTQRHDKGHASMDSVCWKCIQFFICEPVMENYAWDLVFVEKSQNTPCKILISLDSLPCKIYSISMNLIWFIFLIEWKLFSLWVNKSLALSCTLSLNAEFYGIAYPYWRFDPVSNTSQYQASIDSVCWKCTQACICEPLKTHLVR